MIAMSGQVIPAAAVYLAVCTYGMDTQHGLMAATRQELGVRAVGGYPHLQAYDVFTCDACVQQLRNDTARPLATAARCRSANLFPDDLPGVGTH
jgi:hypothetical protein